MKIHNLIGAFLVFALVACSGKDNPVTPYVSISGVSNPLSVAEGGVTQSLTLSASLSWVVSNDASSWISVSPESGKGGSDIPVQITVAKNTGGDRTGKLTFTISGTSTSKTLTIEQKGAEIILPDVLFSESFHEGLGSFTVYNKSQGGMTKDIWTFNADHPEYGAIASGYDSGSRYTTEGWLVSPEISIHERYEEVYLRFDQALAYAGGNSVTQFIGLKISTDAGQNWTNLSIPNLPNPNSRFEKIGSGDVDLKAYIGKTIQFALTYKSNDTAQPTWEVMDLEIANYAKPLQKEDYGDEYEGVPAWMELPKVEDDDDFYIHTAPYETTQNVRNYSFIYDDDHLVAPWVAYPLCDLYTKKRVDRTDAWAIDPFVPIQAIFYKAGDIYDDGKGGAKYNRGHQLPSADRLGSTVMNQQTFYFTNIAPQLADDAFNAGIWGDLENAVREWSSSENSTDTLYVVTGCALDAPIEYRKDNEGKQVSVPNGFFKALLRLSKGEYIGAAFYFDHKSYQGQPVTIGDFSLSIAELEEKMGMTFFVNLPSDKAKAIKAEKPKDNKFWNL